MTNNLKTTTLHDRVLVKPAPTEERITGGIIIPDTAKALSISSLGYFLN